MLPTVALTYLLVLILTVTGKPVVIRDSLISLPIAKTVNGTSARHLLKQDQARAKALRAHAEAKLSGAHRSKNSTTSVPVENQAVIYTASVGIGSPATTYTLLIDTGSSNTWVGAGKAYVRTNTSMKTSDHVSVTYGSGTFSGTEFMDTVSLGSGLTITNQSIGVASSSNGLPGFDGILGIGPADLTIGTLSPGNRSPIPTVTDNLFNQEIIAKNLVAVSFEPTTNLPAKNGELTFGGTDSSKFTGSITFTGITSTSPASAFWGIDQSIRYGTSNPILSTTAGIVDTGTTLILLASDAFRRYRSATRAVADNNTGLLRLTTAQYKNLQSLFFTVGRTTFELTANAQIWPRSLNSFIGGTSNNVYLIVGDLGSNSREGLDFINGLAFLERFYSVFDTDKKRVGLATTRYTYATTN
ncbi:hypothetical protein EW146_g7101 [Bondarzewia mesenterica]|uniref:Peptidase A1 domain-containing protein n=1 Tax=Bondarzewia mesenterica TaxID=1095465 RepID=A0A4S4LLQ5_9AGAM|nr:hypothetical protein EW146_g7101 [Bondarzewia mesenterica]